VISKKPKKPWTLEPGASVSRSYIPSAGDGDLKQNICAFARQGQREVVLVIVPRFLARLPQMREVALGTEAWGDSSIGIPSEIVEQRFSNIFTGEKVDASVRGGKNRLILGQIFANFPVAMLEGI
jgi:(1->4)-alpha-D-glucan 1-alpha-D-glucosylmutase